MTKQKKRNPRMTPEKKIEEWLAMPKGLRTMGMDSDRGIIVLYSYLNGNCKQLTTIKLSSLIAKRYPRRKK